MLVRSALTSGNEVRTVSPSAGWVAKPAGETSAQGAAQAQAEPPEVGGAVEPRGVVAWTRVRAKRAGGRGSGRSLSELSIRSGAGPGGLRTRCAVFCCFSKWREMPCYYIYALLADA